jgi:hypothetical protein
MVVEAQQGGTLQAQFGKRFLELPIRIVPEDDAPVIDLEQVL